MVKSDILIESSQTEGHELSLPAREEPWYVKRHGLIRDVIHFQLQSRLVAYDLLAAVLQLIRVLGTPIFVFSFQLIRCLHINRLECENLVQFLFFPSLSNQGCVCALCAVHCATFVISGSDVNNAMTALAAHFLFIVSGNLRGPSFHSELVTTVAILCRFSVTIRA